MNITLDLNHEQLDAMTSAAERCGHANAQEWIEAAIIQPAIALVVAEAYALAVARLGEAAKALSYESRMALIAQVADALKQ